VLGERGESLIEQKLEVLMVCSDHKRSSPQIRPPVLHCLDEGDEFTLVCHQLGVSLCHLTAEEGHWSGALVEHRVETVT
jgi:hypothetical protein